MSLINVKYESYSFDKIITPTINYHRKWLIDSGHRNMKNVMIAID